MLLSLCVAHNERETWWRRDCVGSETWAVQGHERGVDMIHGEVSVVAGPAIVLKRQCYRTLR